MVLTVTVWLLIQPRAETQDLRDRSFFFFYNLSLLYQWQWKAGVLDFHPGLHSDDVTGRGLGLTTHQREHHESTSELFFLYIYILKKKGDQMKCFNSTKFVHA